MKLTHRLLYETESFLLFVHQSVTKGTHAIITLIFPMTPLSNVSQVSDTFNIQILNLKYSFEYLDCFSFGISY